MDQIKSWLGKKVLIVDDMKTMRDDLVRILTSVGFTDLHQFPDGKAAWSSLLDESHYGKPYELVFSDINMPVMNGIELLKHMRLNDVYKKTPIFMVSTETEKDIILTAILNGATDYILKPYQTETVLKKILQHLK